MTDEVYEHLVYSPHEHVRLASLPDMWERVLTVSSAGKTFSITGHKIGWVVGSSCNIKPVMSANQWVQFSVSTPSQVAVGGALEQAAQPYEGHDTYYSFINALYVKQIKRMSEIFDRHGMTPHSVQGTYYIVADISSMEDLVPDKFKTNTDGSAVSFDYAFARWFVQVVGVCVIPCSAFYRDETKHLGSHLIRLACCKSDETLDETEKRLLAALPVVK
jgi:aspartate/methionine/tyrosine aminotransferase